MARLKRGCTHVTQRHATQRIRPTSGSRSRFIKFLTRNARHVQIFVRRVRRVIRGARLTTDALNSTPIREKPCQSRGNASSCRLPLLPDALRQNNSREILVHTVDSKVIAFNRLSLRIMLKRVRRKRLAKKIVKKNYFLFVPLYIY